MEKGKEYDYSGKLSFEGEFKNGKRNGIGKEYVEGKLIFDGRFLNGNNQNASGRMEILNMKVIG